MRTQWKTTFTASNSIMAYQILQINEQQLNVMITLLLKPGYLVYI